MKDLGTVFEETYFKEAEEQGPVEIVLDLEEGREQAKIEVDQDKSTNIFEIDSKLPANKAKTFHLKDLKQAKIGKKRFDNEPPSKELVDFQKQTMEEVVKGQ